MDAVRAVLVLPADAEPPAAEAADAIVALPPHDAADFAAARGRTAALLPRSDRLYLAAPPIESGAARGYLAAALQPGVYGVAAPAAASLDQLRYLESILEDLEARADIRPGLTAMALRFDTPAALAIMPEALAALQRSAGRVTWVGWSPQRFADALAVPEDSPTVAQAAAQVVLAAAARGLPAVHWTAGRPSGAEIRAARRAGFRGLATSDRAALPHLSAAFPAPEPDSDPEEPQ